jgi:Carboxypeptidase regulatory-like domain
VKQGHLRILGALVLTVCVSPIAPKCTVAQSKLAAGKLSGLVRDAAGTPQMGASVEVLPEGAGILAAHDFLTNTQGLFRGDQLPVGDYTVRVTLAGFLPSIERHVHISSNLTTVVRVELESMFASLDRLRRQPSNSNAEPDDWKWVLRSAPSLRPVLEWTDSSTVSVSNVNLDNSIPRPVRMRLEFTDGALRVASPSNVAPAPSTAFAYDQNLGGAGRLIIASQVSYDEDAPGGGMATIWLPSGRIGAGPYTAVVLREAKSSPDGPLFRGVRIDQGGSFGVGDRAVLRFGSEYVLVGLGRAASSIRPRMELNVRTTTNWHTALIFASLPVGPNALDVASQEDSSADSRQGDELAAALGELDAFPALLWRGGRPVLQSGWHEEVNAERKFGSRGALQIAAFHDDQSHVAVYGRGNDLPAADYLQDFYGNGFSYDGGSSSSWGGRIAWTEKLTDNLQLTAVYAYAGALVPSADTDDLLRDVLQTAPRHSLGANLSAKVPRLGTKLDTGYKWVAGGSTVSRVDLYGESLFQMDPFFHFGFRQPLPRFGLGRWEAVAECDNLFAQGYVPVGSRDGDATLLTAFRTFRGGLSVQF